ncbi:MAG: hypothetical protein J2P37_06810 [Ktedonobacteraceae bacterium]|nr:hypothetical protein [Ktedonobacteraceae bacterium]
MQRSHDPAQASTTMRDPLVAASSSPNEILFLHEAFQQARMRGDWETCHALLRCLRRDVADDPSDLQQQLAQWEAELLLAQEQPALVLATLFPLVSTCESEALRGRALLQLGNVAAARYHLHLGLQLARASRQRKQALDLLCLLGYLARRRGDFEQAMSFYRLAQQRCVSGWSASTLATVLNNMANIFSLRGQTTAAQRVCIIARRLREQLSRMGRLRQAALGLSMSTQGLILLRAGMLHDAEAHFHTALDRFERCGYRRGMEMACHRLGQVALERGHLNQANRWLVQMAHPLDPEVAIMHEHLRGQLATQQGDLSGAATHFQHALALAAQQGDRYHYVENLLGLAGTWERLHLVAEARQWWQAAVLLCRQAHYPLLLTQVPAALRLHLAPDRSRSLPIPYPGRT